MIGVPHPGTRLLPLSAVVPVPALALQLADGAVCVSVMVRSGAASAEPASTRVAVAAQRAATSKRVRGLIWAANAQHTLFLRVSAGSLQVPFGLTVKIPVLEYDAPVQGNAARPRSGASSGGQWPTSSSA